jgi:hypothetical protein
MFVCVVWECICRHVYTFLFECVEVSFIKFLLFISLVILGLLGRHCTTITMPQPTFVYLMIFWIGSSIFGTCIRC